MLKLRFIPLLIVLMKRFVNGLLTKLCFDFKAFDIVKNAALPKFKVEAIIKNYVKYVKEEEREKISEKEA